MAFRDKEGNMRAVSEQALILGKLKWAVEHFPFRRLFYAVAGQPLVTGAGVQAWPRLDMALSGSVDIELPLRDGAAKLHLRAGDAYYALPNSWEAYQWERRLELLCVVPRTSYLRVSFYNFHPEKGGGPRVSPVPVYHHTTRPYGDALRLTVEAMNALPWMESQDAGADLARAMLRLALRECAQEPVASGGKARATFDKIRTWMENSFDERIDRGLIASRFGVTPSYLSRLFQTMTGMGAQQYVTKLRIDFAKHLLRETSLSVKQIGDQCGFRNHVHFIRRFRELAGIAPGHYRAISSSFTSKLVTSSCDAPAFPGPGLTV